MSVCRDIFTQLGADYPLQLIVSFYNAYHTSIKLLLNSHLMQWCHIIWLDIFLELKKYPRKFLEYNQSLLSI